MTKMHASRKRSLRDENTYVAHLSSRDNKIKMRCTKTFTQRRYVFAQRSLCNTVLSSHKDLCTTQVMPSSRKPCLHDL